MYVFQLTRMELLESWFRFIVWNAVSSHEPEDEINVYIVHEIEEKTFHIYFHMALRKVTSLVCKIDCVHCDF